MSTTAHGLDGTAVEADWPALTLDEVREVAALYRSIGEPTEIVSVSPRPFSAASVVATTAGRVFVKRHAGSVRDRSGLEEEHRFMAHLRQHGLQVPEVFATVNGTTAVEMGAWTYEVHEIPAGVDLYGDALSWTPFFSPDHAHSAGQALARLHEAAAGYEASIRSDCPLVAGFTIFAAQHAGEQFDRYVGARPALGEYLRVRTCRDEALEWLEPFHAELLPLLPEMKRLWTHNDLHGSNLIWSGIELDAQAVSVIDFGLSDRTYAVHDLAHAIERNIIEWLVLVEDPARPDRVPVHFDHLNALLDGYESVRPLSEVEARALVPMMALCHAEFALSETDYFLSILQSEEKAKLACEGYLVAHARWFRGAGQNVLDALRKRAQTRGAYSR